MSARGEQRDLKKRAGLLQAIKAKLERIPYLTKNSLQAAADETNLSLSEVYGTASFYSYLPVETRGTYLIRVCRCVPCDMKSAPGIIETIRKELGIAPGETTADGLFSLELAGCLGACDRAPAMMINDEIHGELDAGKTVALLRSLMKNNESPR
jgi:NADH:ubiquinone oxidoreductase subunit E